MKQSQNAMMNAEQWRQLEQLYHEALACGTNQREEFIAEACGKDGELLPGKLKSLLAQNTVPGLRDKPALENAADLLNSETAVQDRQKSTDPLEAFVLSRHRLIEPLGSGGTGVVYKAHDVRLHRMVALKFLNEPRNFTVSSIILLAINCDKSACPLQIENLRRALEEKQQ